MSADLRELLRSAVPPLGPGPGLAELQARATRRRRRRVLGRGCVALLAAGAAATAVVMLSSSDGPSRGIEVRPAQASNPAAGVSITLPPGWKNLPRVNNGSPNEILAVGTATRPRQDPITGCPTGEAPPRRGAIYLSLYEYPSLAGPVALPGKFPLPLTPDHFGARGADGAVYHAIETGGNECDKFVPGVPQLGDYGAIPFQDSGRYLVARIATVGTDPTYRWARAASTVLKTLRVEPKPGTPAPPTTTPIQVPPSARPSVPRLRQVNVAVFNATGASGAAAATANVLRGLGYSIATTGNANALQTGTTVVCRAGHAAAARDLAQRLSPGTRILSKFPNSVPTPPGQQLPPTRLDCLVTIGR